MKKIFLITIISVISCQVFGQLISVSSLSIGMQYRKLYPDGEYVKNTNLPNYDFRWRIEIFHEKAWRISIQPGVFSILYSLHDEMYDNSFTSKRLLCPSISLNFEKHFKNKEGLYKWDVFGGASIANLYENGVAWRSFKWLDWIDFTPFSYYLQIGGMYRFNENLAAYTQFNLPWIRNLNYLPINVGLGSNNTSGAYLSTPTLGNERWSITAGVQFGFGRKKE